MREIFDISFFGGRYEQTGKVTIPTTRFGFPDQDSADVAYVQAILELSFG